MSRYFIIRVPADDDGPDARVIVDSESDADLLPDLRIIAEILNPGFPHSHHIIER